MWQDAREQPRPIRELDHLFHSILPTTKIGKRTTTLEWKWPERIAFLCEALEFYFYIFFFFYEERIQTAIDVPELHTTTNKHVSRGKWKTKNKNL